MITKAKSRIIGVRLGEARIDLINKQSLPLVATFALLRDDELLAGKVDLRLAWSEKTLELLVKLQESMEEDALGQLFEPTPTQPVTQEEPKQI